MDWKKDELKDLENDPLALIIIFVIIIFFIIGMTFSIMTQGV